jgi:putative NIF3 family GTP cyclohydrolase 1 type 2
MIGLTIQKIINELIKSVPMVENTVDTLEFGDPSEEVSKVAVAFMPTFDVIKHAIQLGANLLICHEGIFHSHRVAGKSSVGNTKLKMINDAGIAIYRFHDYYHRYKPDGIMEGMIQSLKWGAFVEENQETATILQVSTVSVKGVIEDIKGKLGIDSVRYVGDLAMECNRIGLLVGYRGGAETAIPVFENNNVDLVIYGEGPEWETPEYVRDAISQGENIALIILGHLESEEPGMEYLVYLLREKFPQVPIHFIPTNQNIHVL